MTRLRIAKERFEPMFNHHRWRRMALGAAVAALSLGGCDILDPSDVTNPNPTPSDLANSAAPTTALLPGLRAQMARAVMGVVQTSALVSDDFEISFTNVTGELSDPWEVRPDGGSFNSTGAIGAYWHLQEFRAFSDFVIDSIAVNDENATDAELAEANYFRGMAFLMQGENFKAVPIGPDQQPTPWDELLGLAEENFTRALGLGPDEDLEIAITAALARTHRALGNPTEAESFAQAALALDPALLALQPYSAAEIENPFSLETRTFQPLPRLDFLDPKYTERGSPIPLAKAEEMYLILAEVEMTRGDYDDAAERVARDGDVGFVDTNSATAVVHRFHLDAEAEGHAVVERDGRREVDFRVLECVNAVEVSRRRAVGIDFNIAHMRVVETAPVHVPFLGRCRCGHCDAECDRAGAQKLLFQGCPSSVSRFSRIRRTSHWKRLAHQMRQEGPNCQRNPLPVSASRETCDVDTTQDGTAAW